MGINLNPFAEGNIFGPKETESVPNLVGAPQITTAAGTPLAGLANAQQAAGIGSNQAFGAGTTWQNLQNILASPEAASSTTGAAPIGAATVGTGGTYGSAVTGQQGLAGNLEGTIAGTAGPSVADLQLAQGEQANVAGALATLGSQRGGGINPNLIARSAVDSAAANAANLNQQAGIQRAGEVATAQGQLGSVLGTTAGEAGAVNAANAGYVQQSALANQGVVQATDLANQNTAVANAANLNATRLGVTGQEGSLAQNQAANATSVAQSNTALQNSTNALNAGIATGNTQAVANNDNSLIKTGGTLLAAGAALSDRKEKKEIKSIDDMSDDDLLVLSDENLKAGIAGTNPMQSSFQRFMSELAGDSSSAKAAASKPWAPGDSYLPADFHFKKPTPDAPGPTEDQEAAAGAAAAAAGAPPPQPSFGQGVVPADASVGISGDEAANALPTAGLNFGSGAVPYTPVAEQFATPGGQFELDPSVVAATQGQALSDKKAKEDVHAAAYDQGVRDTVDHFSSGSGSSGGSYGSGISGSVGAGSGSASDAPQTAPPAFLGTGGGSSGGSYGSGIAGSAGGGTGGYIPAQASQTPPEQEFAFVRAMRALGLLSPNAPAQTPPPVASDKETKKEISSASYEQGLRDALATAPGSGSAALPLPRTSETLPRPMVDAFRRIMADSAPAQSSAPVAQTPPPAPPVAIPLQPQAMPAWLARANESPFGDASSVHGMPGPEQISPQHRALAEALNEYQSQQAAANQPPQAPPSATVSDEREKTDKRAAKPDPVRPDPDDVENMLDNLRAYTYRYKDPTMEGAAPGRQTGVMAQDLEKSPLGKQFVKQGPGGYKMVDYGHAASTMMAGQAYLNERLNDHERMLRSMGAK